MAFIEFYQPEPKVVNVVILFLNNAINLMIGDQGDSWERANSCSSSDPVLKEHKPSASSF